MSSRRDFLQNSAAIVGSLALTSNLAKADGKEQRIAIDKLTDSAGKYVLAPLPYAYDALEPVIDARTVELHYNFHHKPAVAAAIKAEDALASVREKNDFTLVKHYEKELAFQLSSHILHTIYWTNLSPKFGKPSGVLLKALEQNFQSFDQFKSHMVAATVGVEGSGWGILGYLPSSGKLMILQCENHQKLTAWGIIPILVLDVWEHAYYLKYQNKRAEYINGLFSIINWDNIALRYEAAIS